MKLDLATYLPKNLTSYMNAPLCILHNLSLNWILKKITNFCTFCIDGTFKNIKISPRPRLKCNLYFKPNQTLNINNVYIYSGDNSLESQFRFLIAFFHTGEYLVNWYQNITYFEFSIKNLIFNEFLKNITLAVYPKRLN